MPVPRTSVVISQFFLRISIFLEHLLSNPIRTSSVISQFFLRTPVVISQFFLRTSVVFLLCTTWTSFFMFVSNAFWCKYLLGYIVSCDATFSCNFVLCEFLRYIGETFVRTIRSMHSILNDILQCFHHVRKKIVIQQISILLLRAYIFLYILISACSDIIVCFMYAILATYIL